MLSNIPISYVKTIVALPKNEARSLSSNNKINALTILKNRNHFLKTNSGSKNHVT